MKYVINRRIQKKKEVQRITVKNPVDKKFQVRSRRICNKNNL